MRIAVYDPSPRICGPATMVPLLISGFRELGCDAESVVFTKSGKRRLSWGRIEPEKGSTMSLQYSPDRCEPLALAGPVFDEYDLVVLIEVVCPPLDGTDDVWPEYVEALAASETPFTTAVHGRYVFEESDPVPEGFQPKAACPFVSDLLNLENFSGFLLEFIGRDLASERCAALRKCRRAWAPLPYRLRVEDYKYSERIDKTICTLGRTTRRKYKHYVNWARIAGHLTDWDIVHAGGCVATHGPSESYILYEQLIEAGWVGEREPGTRRNVKWEAWHPEWTDNGAIRFEGTYGHPREVVPPGAQVFCGLTDENYSGGLHEFGTLEAIDCGMVPVVPKSFRVEDSAIRQVFLPFWLSGHHGRGSYDLSQDELAQQRCEWLAMCCEEALEMRNESLVTANREAVAREHAPVIACEAYLKGVGLR